MTSVSPVPSAAASSVARVNDSLANGHFTLVCNTGEEYKLPLVDAEHCTTLAWLIPSNTLSFILPATCTAASIPLVASPSVLSLEHQSSRRTNCHCASPRC